jgi:hypothetical protein
MQFGRGVKRENTERRLQKGEIIHLPKAYSRRNDGNSFCQYFFFFFFNLQPDLTILLMNLVHK